MKKLQLQKSNDDIINGQFMNTLFHTINYYHKILIQFIYLSYVKGDLVKIGESILDYIEFLIKFKFKTSSDEKYFLKIKYKDNQERPEYREGHGFCPLYEGCPVPRAHRPCVSEGGRRAGQPRSEQQGHHGRRV